MRIEREITERKPMFKIVYYTLVPYMIKGWNTHLQVPCFKVQRRLFCTYSKVFSLTLTKLQFKCLIIFYKIAVKYGMKTESRIILLPKTRIYLVLLYAILPWQKFLTYGYIQYIRCFSLKTKMTNSLLLLPSLLQLQLPAPNLHLLGCCLLILQEEL